MIFMLDHLPQRRKKRTETPTGTARVRRPHRKWVSSEEAEAVPEESEVRFYRSGGLAHSELNRSALYIKSKQHIYRRLSILKKSGHFICYIILLYTTLCWFFNKQFLRLRYFYNIINKIVGD